MKQNNPTELLGYPTLKSEGKHMPTDTIRPHIGYEPQSCSDFYRNPIGPVFVSYKHRFGILIRIYFRYHRCQLIFHNLNVHYFLGSHTLQLVHEISNVECWAIFVFCCTCRLIMSVFLLLNCLNWLINTLELLRMLFSTN